MTEAEQACYMERYTDVGETPAVEHYVKIGQKQGRHFRCGPYMTWIMTGRYVDRYYWIGDEYGRTYKSMPLARE
jgi:hypothetical protein